MWNRSKQEQLEAARETLAKLEDEHNAARIRVAVSIEDCVSELTLSGDDVTRVIANAKGIRDALAPFDDGLRAPMIQSAPAPPPAYPTGVVPRAKEIEPIPAAKFPPPVLGMPDDYGKIGEDGCYLMIDEHNKRVWTPGPPKARNVF